MSDSTGENSLRKKRRKHRNSRRGCAECKSRRIKCGEELPICYNCLEKEKECSYLRLSQEELEDIFGYPNPSHVPEHEPKLEPELAKLSDPKVGIFNFTKLPGDLRNYELVVPIRNDPGEANFSGVFDACVKNNSNNNKNNNRRNRKPLTNSPPLVYPNLKPRPRFNTCVVKRKHEITRELMNEKLYGKIPDYYYLIKRKDNEQGPPLKNAKIENAKISLVKVRRCYWYYESLISKEKFLICGEDDASFGHYRKGIENWFQSFIEYGHRSFLQLNSDAILASMIIIINLKNRSEPRIEDGKILEFLEDQISRKKASGFKIAQSVIDKLNMTPNSNNNQIPRVYLEHVHEVIAYSMVNVGSSLLLEKQFPAFIAYVGGFITTSLTKQLVLNFESAKNDNDVIYQVALLKKVFPFIHSNFISNFKSLCVPNLQADLIEELFDDAKDFQLKLTNLNEDLSKSDMKLQIFINFVEKILSKNLVPDYEAVTTYHPQDMYEILSEFFTIFPSDAMFINQKQDSVDPLNKICLLYWLALTNVLDNIFPEALFLFLIKFSGTVRFCGINIDFQRKLIEELKSIFKGEELDYLIRRIFYLTRLISYTSYRWRLYDRNTEIPRPYPKSMYFKQNRFQSRKNPFIKEVTLKSLKKQRLTELNYPKYDYNDPNLDDTHFFHPKNSKFEDRRLSENVNVDLNYKKINKYIETHGFDIDTIPLRYLGFCAEGLLINIDFRPKILRSISRLDMSETYFTNFELELNQFAEDWREIVDHYSQDNTLNFSKKKKK